MNFNPHEYSPFDTSNQIGLENMVSLLSFFSADMKVLSEDTEKIFESHFFLVSYENETRFIIFFISVVQPNRSVDKFKSERQLYILYSK
jgi:hypothetical protein